MNKLRSKPSNWWYLPPAIVGIFFIFVMGVFSPVVPMIFVPLGMVVGAIAYFFAYSVVKESFHKEKSEAKEWALIAMAWFSVIAWYVLSELLWCEFIGC